MRCFAVLFLFAAFCSLYGIEEPRKFQALGGYSDVQIMSVSHRGIQISHADGMCLLNDADLNDSEKLELKAELEQVAAMAKAHAEKQKQLARLRAQEAKNARKQQEIQAKAQTAEIQRMLKAFANKDIIKILTELEKRFGVTKNYRLGLRGRCNEISRHIKRQFNLAKNHKQLIALINRKRTEREKQLREASRRKAEEARRRAEEAKRQNK